MRVQREVDKGDAEGEGGWRGTRERLQMSKDESVKGRVCVYARTRTRARVTAREIIMDLTSTAKDALRKKKNIK